MHMPGSAGMTTDRLGDAKPWVFEDKAASDDTLVAREGDNVVQL